MFFFGGWSREFTPVTHTGQTHTGIARMGSKPFEDIKTCRDNFHGTAVSLGVIRLYDVHNDNDNDTAAPQIKCCKIKCSNAARSNARDMSA